MNMGQMVRNWMPACVAAAAALGSAGVSAQSQDVQRGLSQVLRAMQSLQGGVQASAGASSVGSLDSAQNLETVVAAARERKRVSGSTMSSESWCQAGARPFMPARIQGSGWMDLVRKCTAVLDEDENNRANAVEAQEFRRAEIEQAHKSQARQRSDDYEARRQALLAGLKSGAVQPQNCAQWMFSRGMDRYKLQTIEVSRVAYRAPQGVGYFDAVIQQIKGQQILVRIDDHLAVVAIDKSARLFREEAIMEKGRIGVVGQQTGQHPLNHPDGSTLTVAVVTPSCVVGAPDHLLDLMPESAK
ncbi:hypothetical protein J2W25_004639 [Variovorax boronicumulans]|uniref:Uncharacterized protein n=1 Tax=Variovorax boronicumulans TaxID=436515 RepID=A0AAW8E1J6_9BURK|nr:hypothetical protein [Variovorax boronicumulans]MDP9880310.1 hypothetical protein [Variovorax boronicumulans]MDP9925596.1 hypothetical protein [Variovorax boronicumulans]